VTENVASSAVFINVQNAVFKDHNLLVDLMGAILVTYKVFPEDILKDFDPLKTEIVKILPDASKIEGWGEEPVAFGLVALLVQIRFPEDVMGLVDTFEVELGKIKGVSQVQTFQIRRTSKDF